MVKKELLRFAIAGTVGFVVDAGVLYLVKDSLGYYLGRALSFFLAVFCTWLLNRQFTFHQKASGVSRFLSSSVIFG
jgi:putative flippase GtrA